MIPGRRRAGSLGSTAAREWTAQEEITTELVDPKGIEKLVKSDFEKIWDFWAGKSAILHQKCRK